MSAVVRVPPGAELLFLSGLTGRAADGTVIEGLEPQTHRVFGRLEETLAAEGARVSDLVKLTTFLRNADDLSAVATIRREYLDEPLPALTTVEVSRLADARQLIEIDAVAAVVPTIRLTPGGHSR
jgi:2-iminobutanoate/2-iminopropanoate deaminase